MDGPNSKADPPDERVFAGCRVYALDAAHTTGEALVTSDGRVTFVGGTDDARRIVRPDTEWVDLGGKTIIPGLVDSHNHLLHFGVSATRAADLSGSDSVAEIVERLRRFRETNLARPWLLGERFDHELLSDGRWPTRRDLDSVSREIPIMIARLCLHAIVANTAALEPVKGKLSPEQFNTGILAEDAAELIWSQVPEPTTDELSSAALWAMGEARRVGLTGVHAIVEGRDELGVLRSLHDRGQLSVRLYVPCPLSMLDVLRDQGLHTGSGDEWLRVGGLKFFVDGAMGARTAAMRQPFTDDPDNSGELFRNEREVADVLREIQPHGFQASIHAIGDRAVECSLEGIRQAAATGNPGNRLRHRVEHSSQMARDLVDQMARLKVIACVQPQFVLTDFWTHERVGPDRYGWSYPFKTMLEGGVTLAMGSDCPVERLDPIELLHRAVNREPRSLGERLTVEETIRAYSWGSAFAGFAENYTGCLEPGKLADFTVLSADPFSIPPSEIETIRVEATAIGGVI